MKKSPTCHSERSETPPLLSFRAQRGPLPLRAVFARSPLPLRAVFARRICFSSSLMKFAAVSPSSGPACPPQAGLPAEGGLAGLFLKGSLWKLGPGVDLFGIGDIPPLKTKSPGGSRDALLYKRTLPYQ